MTMSDPLESLAKGREIRLFSLGRHAFAAALRIAGVLPNDKVLLPGFVCRELLAPIRAANAVPVFYDVDRALQPCSLSVHPGAKAVVAVNYFGFSQSLDPFRAYCAAQGSCLIEDNAHGFLSRDESGELLGCRGDLGIASFRKTFATPDGAALILNRNEWAASLPEPLACDESTLPLRFAAKRALRRFQNVTGLRVRNQSELAMRFVRRLVTGHQFPPSDDSEDRIPGVPAIHCRSLREVMSANEQLEAARRRDLYGWFSQRIGELGIRPVFPALHPGAVPLGFPFRADDHGVQRVARMACGKGLDCAGWPDLPAQIAQRAPEHYRDVSYVNFLW